MDTIPKITASSLTYYFYSKNNLAMSEFCLFVYIGKNIKKKKKNSWLVDFFSFHEGKISKQYHKLINFRLQVPWNIYHFGKVKKNST
jgi:hypothetical protein